MISNTHISEIKEIPSPAELIQKYKASVEDCAFLVNTRKDIENILQGLDPRFMVIAGPCSIHDYDSAIEYAKLFQTFQSANPNLYMIMRVYFEKPRSRTGWKGFIYDPDLCNSFQIQKGLALARKLLLELTQMRIPVGCEFLDTVTPQYLADLVSWGAIGARTSESQIHRQLASGLSMPIGFKNLTSGDYEKAIDGIISATYPHNFLGIDDKGKACHVITKGNPNSHLILRGGDEPNYKECCIRSVTASLQREKISTGMIVDCSHGNSQKQYNRQILVALYIKRLFLLKKYPIRGIMLESNLQKGNQPLSFPLKKGVSITDACIDGDITKYLLQLLNAMNTCVKTTIPSLRSTIRTFDEIISRILKGETVVDIQHIESMSVFEDDLRIYEICKDLPNSELLLMMISIRTSFSNRLSELKFEEKPFDFLYKNNDCKKLLTYRDIEKDILTTFNDPLYLQIIEISKAIQLRCLDQLTNTFRIGYLFGKGTFSHETVNANFRGIHIAYPDVSSLYIALYSQEVDAILLPTYNSIIGEIFSLTDDNIAKKGSIDHPIELSLYCNKPIQRKDLIDILYVEKHVQRECEQYILKNLRYKQCILVKSSVEGCIQCVQNTDKVVATISSKHNSSVLLNTIDTDLVDHNVTTFTLLTKKIRTPPRLAESSDSAYIDSHYC